MDGSMLRVLVCGGREFDDFESICSALGKLRLKHGISVIIHGGARGADFLAGQWARQELVPEIVYPADWSAQGKAAGPIRNQLMIDEAAPDCIVAFPGGRGTADMISRGRTAGLRIWEVRVR